MVLVPAIAVAPGAAPAVSLEFAAVTRQFGKRVQYLRNREGGVGTESFRFDLNAGLALASVTDVNGNVTSFVYDAFFF